MYIFLDVLILFYFVSAGQRSCGDESPSGEEDGPEREGKEGGETSRAGSDGPRPQGRDQKSWR